MNIRLQYQGGEKQQSRMIEDKLKSLKKALLYSYQAGTMVIDNPDYNKDNNTPEQLEFRCLMNPDKRTFETDKMMLSVPFKDVCLNLPRKGKTTEGYIEVPVKCGKTFKWKETNTRWLVTLQYIEELAYFRADVRKCFDYPIDLNGHKYYFAGIGENETTLEWRKHNREEWNKMNYTRTIYIERNPETLDYFKRFQIVKIPNIQNKLESWEVQAVAPNSTDDVLIVHVKEYFENKFEDLSNEIQEEIKEYHELEEDLVCKVYDRICYTTKYIPDALWSIENKTSGLNIKIEDAIIRDDLTTVYLQLLNGKTGEFDLLYNNKKVKHIVVESL